MANHYKLASLLSLTTIITVLVISSSKTTSANKIHRAASSPAPRGGIKGAYWPSWLATNLPPQNIPTSYFTHVFYAFVLIDPNTFEIVIDQNDDQWMQSFTSVLHAATPPAKSILSIGGAGAVPATFSAMVGDPNSRAQFINSSVATARKYGFDGLDLDWEFPQNPQDMSNLALLYKEWRYAIDADPTKPRLILSSAVYFASALSQPEQRTYPGHAINQFVDFISPMCFDYHGSWEPSETGAHASLYDKTSNLSTSYGVSSWKGDNVQSKKIVMGLPAYGRTWQLQDPAQHGIGAPAVGTGPGGGVLIYSDILSFNSQNNATVVYDDTTVSAYSYSGTNWIGYDDVDSITQKMKYAKGQGLGGYFFWALGDDSNWELAKAASTAWDSAN